MRIVILADSLAMARSGETNVAFDATYPFLLEQSLRKHPETRDAMVIERGMRRRTIEYVLDEWSELVELRAPTVAVVHVGIVDCAPRVFLRRERQFIENLRPTWLRDAILRYVHNHRQAVVKFRKKVYVPPDRFQRLVNQVIEKAKLSDLKTLVFVNIITPPIEMEERSPGFIANVQHYNQILESAVKGSNCELIDLNRIVKENGGVDKLTVDGIHINDAGHRMLAREIENHVIKVSKQEVSSKVNVGGQV